MPVASLPLVRPAPTEIAPLPINSNPIVPYVPNTTLPATSTPITNGVVPQGTVPAPSNPAETAKKPWRPGANLQAWLQGKPAPSPDTAKADVAKANAAKAETPKQLTMPEDTLALQNKAAQKELVQRVEKMSGAPFSTAMMPSLPNAPQPDKKLEASPLAIPNGFAGKDDKPFVLPPPPKEDPLKTVGGQDAPKRDMWGNPLLTPVPTPGKTLLDSNQSKNPLTSPERLIGDDRFKVKPSGGMAPPYTQTGMLPVAPDLPANPNVGRPVNWPLGTRSVEAANNGILGNPQYIPVPMVTRPESAHPPIPPAPNVPEAPNLNRHVNAFSEPPASKGQYQPQPWQAGMMPPQAMMPPQGMMPPPAMAPYYGNPMMTQQQMMMHQQMLAQQQVIAQQHMMLQYGYRPNPGMMNPYMPQPQMAMPSSGPMTNFSRHYAGPSAPNPFATNPMMQTGYAPASYPPQMPMHAMMPQPAAYPQPTMPMPQQGVTQQVEQMIKVLRESPYPAQRAWAAQSLTTFEWRANPQIVPMLLQSATQDPVANVRAGCVNSLSRMNAAVEPVFGALHTLRNDIDPTVRQEVEQAFMKLGQTAQMPREERLSGEW